MLKYQKLPVFKIKAMTKDSRYKFTDFSSEVIIFLWRCIITACSPPPLPWIRKISAVFKLCAEACIVPLDPLLVYCLTHYTKRLQKDFMHNWLRLMKKKNWLYCTDFFGWREGGFNNNSSRKWFFFFFFFNGSGSRSHIWSKTVSV